MKRVGLYVSSAILGYAVACAPVQFENSVACGAGFNCVNINGQNSYDYETSVGGGKVDILIVTDNSASMSTEQRNMAQKMANFLSRLTQNGTRDVDYRIAVTTTDISASDFSGTPNSPRAINGNGALQDGKLIDFTSGTPFVTPQTANKESLFLGTIQRQETLNCETALNTNPALGNSMSAYLQSCPSPDERGIYAANLVVLNNPSGFIRSNSALAVVFLADEDERSSWDNYGYASKLDEKDFPQTLINNVQSKFPGKNFKAHSIIIKPGSIVNGETAQTVASDFARAFGANGTGALAKSYFTDGTDGDSACLTQQKGQSFGSGSGKPYGYLYALATRMTSGVEGSVCASDYTTQLGTIADNIGEQLSSITLACSSPKELTVQFLSGPQVAYEVIGNQLKFTPPMTAGGRVKLSYKCDQVK